MNEKTIPDTTLKGVRGEAHRPTAAIPRWVIGFLAILLILALVFVILHFTGQGMGGMHMSIPETGRHAL